VADRRPLEAVSEPFQASRRFDAVAWTGTVQVVPHLAVTFGTGDEEE
jgi:hypothetical protein